MSTRSKILSALAALAVTIGVILGAPAATSIPSGAAALSGDDVLVVGGVIRFDEDGPYWHINGAHHTVGFDTSVPPTIDASGRLHVEILDPHAVISATAASDESLTANGIFGGISGGVGDANITFYKTGVNGADGVKLNLNNPVHYDRISCANCNTWITILQDANAPAGG